MEKGIELKTCYYSMLEGYVKIKLGGRGLTLNSEFIHVSLFILPTHFVFNKSEVI